MAKKINGNYIMAYVINKTNGETLFVVQDGGISSVGGLTFFGKKYPNYGKLQNENFLKLLENFSNSTAPTSPLEGQLWWDSANRSIKIYDTTQVGGWVELTTVKSIVGTVNQIDATVSGKTVTLSLPQSIDTAATPTFQSVFANNFYGNSSTSSALETSRKINGTDFDGSSDITTTIWGTSRKISIGGIERTVDGSQNISWSLRDIGLDSVTKDESLVGQVATFARTTAPPGWIICDGRAVSRTTYSALFSAIGTLYGEGDGTTTFNVPDCRDEFFRGWTGNTDVVGTKFSDTYAEHNHKASSGTAGSHGHTASADGAGSHTHTGTATGAGNHSHRASVAGAGNHVHSTQLGDAITSGESTTISSGGGLIDLYDGQSMRAAGDHTHSVGIGLDGFHTHSVSVSAAGDHAHGVSVVASGDHSHSITVNNSGSSETRPRGIYFLVCIRY